MSTKLAEGRKSQMALDKQRQSGNEEEGGAEEEDVERPFVVLSDK